MLKLMLKIGKLWLLLILLTGCTMLWDNGKDGVEIGGKTVTPATIRLYGDETLAQKYIGVGRQILGSLKQQMDLGGLKALHTDVKLDDGTKIRAKSNMWGLADIDEIWIDVTSALPVVGIKTCKVIGYVVQGFSPANSTYFPFDLTTPSSKTLSWYPKDPISTYLDVYDSDPRPDWRGPPLFEGYPDNGAKYLDLFVWDATAYPETSTPSELEKVFVVHRVRTDINLSYYVDVNLGLSSGGVIWRRADGNGFLTSTGVNVNVNDKLIEFKAFRSGYGEGSLVMLPSGGDPKYAFDDEIIAINSIQGQNFTPHMQDAFGIPVTVEPGKHTIRTGKLYLYGIPTKIIVHLMVDCGNGTITFVNTEIDNVTTATNPGVWAKKITIDIRDIGTLSNALSVISVEDDI